MRGMPAGIPTGFPTLDRVLPGGGWPPAGLVELLLSQEGIGELRILIPGLLAVAGGERWLAMVDPPHVPYPAGLDARGVDVAKLLWIRGRPGTWEGVWAAEQALGSGACAAVLLWSRLDRDLDMRILRRLQIAAQAGGALCVFFRDIAAAGQPSPAMLRLGLEPVAEGLSVEILKCRRRPPGRVTVEMRHA